jgi:hypothetical protein
LGFIPAMILLLNGALILFLKAKYNYIYDIFKSIYKGLNGYRYGFFDARIFEYWPVSIIQFFSIGLFLCSIILILYILYNKQKIKFLSLSAAILLGTATAVAMGLSATLWISHWRTAIFFYYSMTIITVAILLDINSVNGRNHIFKVLYILGSLNYTREILYAI